MLRARNLLALLLLALLVPIAAIACGDDDDDDDTGSDASPSAAVTTAAATSTTAAASPAATPEKIGGDMILATTTSTADSGLLDVLVPMFKEQTGVEVKVVAVGTGAALEMAATGDADGVLVHSPTSEQKYVDSGDIIQGAIVMHNDYVLVGPPADPAGVKSATTLKDALTKIAATGPFISRGDNSGTHTKELAIWKAAAIEITAVKDREETGQGMGATLNIADQKQAYTLTDRGTFLSLRDDLDLEVVNEGDKSLLNVYSVYIVNPEKHDGVHREQAEAWAAFLVAPATQQAIADFKKAEYGESLFIPDAGKTLDQVGS